MNKDLKCPFCDAKEFIEVTSKFYGNLVPTDKIFTNKEAQVFHIVCKNCGSIVRSYIKDPDFLDKR